TFNDSSIGTITNRFWNFGDGATTNTSVTNFTHNYNAPRTNTVSLTVTGPVGTNILSQAGYIVVTNPPALLSFSPSNLNFAPLVIGQIRTQNIQMVNIGGQTLTGAVGTTLPFAIPSGSPFTLLPGQTGQVAVSFAPTNAAAFTNLAIF